MKQKSKKVKKIFTFDNDLFDKADMDIINEKIENNIAILMGNDEYMDLDDNRIALNLKLNSYLDDKCQEVLKNYIKTTSEMNNYQNCLAYYLGIQIGINLSELK